MTTAPAATFSAPLDGRLEGLYELAERLAGDGLVPAKSVVEVPEWPVVKVRPPWGQSEVRHGVRVIAGTVLASQSWALATFVLGPPARPTLARVSVARPFSPRHIHHLRTLDG